MKVPYIVLKTTAFYVVLTFLLSGCSSLLNMESWKNVFASDRKLTKLSIIADRQVNGGYPLALDVVIVTEAKALTTLTGLRAAEWFTGKIDLRRQYQNKLTVLTWEIVPGQHFENIVMPIEAKDAVGVLVFADYPGEFSYRATLQNQWQAVIQLRQTDFDVVTE